jgi:hypothetical protein
MEMTSVAMAVVRKMRKTPRRKITMDRRGTVLRKDWGWGMGGAGV